jgi:hypothetical protein
MQEWIKTLATAVISGGIAALVTLWGSTLDYWNRDRELDIRMVDVALTILSGKNEGTTSAFARSYAIDLLSKYGGVEIDEATQLAWSDGGNLPVGNFPTPLKLNFESFLKTFGAKGTEMLQSGTMVIDNGDGTYSRVSPDGTISTKKLLPSEIIQNR